MVEDESPPRERERASDGGAGSPEPAQPPDAFERGKRLLLLACAAIAGGLAIAGTMDRSTGGVVLLAGWGIAVAALHRLGRAGSVRPAKTGRARSARPLRSRS